MASGMKDGLQELRRMVPVSLDAKTHGADFIKLRCYCDFEGHGRASESWEEHWLLELPLVPFHWLSTTGWKLGNAKGGMSFHGKTHQDVLSQALAFMRWFAQGAHNA